VVPLARHYALAPSQLALVNPGQHSLPLNSTTGGLQLPGSLRSLDREQRCIPGTGPPCTTATARAGCATPREVEFRGFIPPHRLRQGTVAAYCRPRFAPGPRRLALRRAPFACVASHAVYLAVRDTQVIGLDGTRWHRHPRVSDRIQLTGAVAHSCSSEDGFVLIPPGHEAWLERTVQRRWMGMIVTLFAGFMCRMVPGLA
jgi:hypothetical protein